MGVCLDGAQAELCISITESVDEICVLLRSESDKGKTRVGCLLSLLEGERSCPMFDCNAESEEPLLDDIELLV